jgi:hypothetical protein
MYRIYQLQPGEYIVNAVPRNQNESDVRAFITTQIASLMQQAQADGINVSALAAAAGGSGEIANRIGLLQQQLAEYESERPTAYAPVFYPGTTAPDSAVAIALSAGEERSAVDFRLQLLPTSRVGGLVVAPDGSIPAGTQVALLPRSGDMPDIPGLGRSMARVGGDGRFAFSNVTPGEYSLQARATVREDGTVAPVGRGRGGQGGQPRQILWAAADLSVGGGGATFDGGNGSARWGLERGRQIGIHTPGSLRRRRGHLPFQLPAQSRLAQARSRHCRRQRHPRQAAQRHAALSPQAD